MIHYILPGSFDPPSLGHLDLIERAAKMCDQLTIAVVKSDKTALTTPIRAEMVETITAHLPNVEIRAFSGLLTQFAKQRGATQIVRGIRPYGDLDYECQLALANRKLTGIETLFLLADPALAHISATLIREIASSSGSLDPFVPEAIQSDLKRLLKASNEGV